MRRDTPRCVRKIPLDISVLLFDVLKVFHLLDGEEFVDAAEVFAHALVAEFVDFRDESVEEVTVVGNDNQCAVEVLKGLFQNVLCLEVEVVGRLVKDEQVDRVEQQLHQRQTGAFASRQNFYFLRAFFTSEHEGSEQVADFVADITYGYVVNGLENGQILVEQRRLVLGK